MEDLPAVEPFAKEIAESVTLRFVGAVRAVLQTLIVIETVVESVEGNDVDVITYAASRRMMAVT